VNTGTKAETPGDKQASNLSSYTLSVNSTNVFVGEAVLVSLVDSRGDLAKGSKVEVTDPNGNTFKVSIDNLQNGFIAKVPGDYLVEYGKKRLVVTVREMDAEIAKLQTVSADEIKGLVEKTEHLYTYSIKGDRINILDANGEHRVSLDLSRLKKLKLKLDGMPLETLRIGAETGTDPKEGEYLQIFVVAVNFEGNISRNTLMGAASFSSSTGEALTGFGMYLLK
jgi:hypothetical protein